MRGDGPLDDGVLDARDLFATPGITSPPRVEPESLAAIVYTSGSTAAPKGALHLHETLVAELASLVVAHGLGTMDRVLMPSPLTQLRSAAEPSRELSAFPLSSELSRR